MEVIWNNSVEIPLDRKPEVVFAQYASNAPGEKMFRLPELWSLLVFHYSMEASFDGRPFHIQPGHLALIPPGGIKYYRHVGQDLMHHVFHFRYPKRAKAKASVPKLVDLAEDYAQQSARLTTAIGWRVNHAERCDLRIWDLLNDLADLGEAGRPEHPPIIEAAQRLLEQSAAQALSMAAIAAQLGYSPGHFSTLFKRHCGIGPAAWLRQRRMARAEHLLRHSSDSISSIAAAIGMPDLQHFNKCVRRQFGCSPSALRGNAQVKRRRLIEPVSEL